MTSVYFGGKSGKVMASRGVRIQNGGSGAGRKKQNRNETTKGSRGGSPGSKTDSTKAGNSLNVVSGGNEPDESWTCEICSTDFTDPDSKLLECQRCKKHFCTFCLGKSDQEYAVMANSDDLMWFCASCRDKVERNIVVDIEIEEKCSSFMQKIEDRLCNLERDIKNKCTKHETKEIVKQELMNLPITNTVSTLNSEMKTKVTKAEVETLISTALQSKNSNNPSIERSVELSVSEIRDSSRREKNVVIHGVREPGEDSPSARKDSDTKYVSDLIDFLEADNDSFTSVVRLGNRKTETDRPRPIKIVFKSVDSKKSLMKKLSKLKSVDDNSKFYRISVTHDMTRTEREMNKTKVEEARDMSKLDNSGKFTFVVRGPPWDRKIVKIPKTL